jgi:hypothetical protein
VNRFLDIFGLRRERVRVQERVDALLAQPGAGSGLTRAEWLALTNRGEALRSAGRAQRGGGDLPRPAGAYPRRGQRPTPGATNAPQTILRIGRTLATQGRPEQAAAAYRQTLAVLARLAQNDTVRRQAGVAHTDLADVLPTWDATPRLGRSMRRRSPSTRKLGDDIAVLLSIRPNWAPWPSCSATTPMRGAATRRRWPPSASLASRKARRWFWHIVGSGGAGRARLGRGRALLPRGYAAEGNGGRTWPAWRIPPTSLASSATPHWRPAEAETWYRRALAVDEQVGSDVRMSPSAATTWPACCWT